MACSTDTLLFRQPLCYYVFYITLHLVFQKLSCLLCAFDLALSSAVCSHVSDSLMLALCILSRSFLCKVCSHVSDSLMLAICILFCHEKYAHEFPTLLYWPFATSFPHWFNTNALIRFIAFSGEVIKLSFSFGWKHMITTFTHFPLYMYSSFTLQAYL